MGDTQNWNMITVLNAKERTLEEFAELFRKADDRFILKQWGETGGAPSSGNSQEYFLWIQPACTVVYVYTDCRLRDSRSHTRGRKAVFQWLFQWCALKAPFVVHHCCLALRTFIEYTNCDGLIFKCFVRFVLNVADTYW